MQHVLESGREYLKKKKGENPNDDQKEKKEEKGNSHRARKSLNLHESLTSSLGGNEGGAAGLTPWCQGLHMKQILLPGRWKHWWQSIYWEESVFEKGCGEYLCVIKACICLVLMICYSGLWAEANIQFYFKRHPSPISSPSLLNSSEKTEISPATQAMLSCL